MITGEGCVFSIDFENLYAVVELEDGNSVIMHFEEEDSIREDSSVIFGRKDMGKSLWFLHPGSIKDNLKAEEGRRKRIITELQQVNDSLGKLMKYDWDNSSITYTYEEGVLHNRIIAKAKNHCRCWSFFIDDDEKKLKKLWETDRDKFQAEIEENYKDCFDISGGFNA